jgi:glyceraldehyde-3-phosphate dehydrogenase (NADP+)
LLAASRHPLTATQHGAHILNKSGGRFAKSLASPTIVGPITKDMKLWSEEQFGPVSPIALYKDINEPLDWVVHSQYGLQSAVFGYDPEKLAKVVDALAMHEGRVNINSPDKRGVSFVTQQGHHLVLKCF